MTAADFGPVWIGAVIAAVISSGVTALGWIVSHRREGRAEARRRLERSVDVQKALRAEVANYVAQLEEVDLADHLERVLAAMRDDPGFVPFVPRESFDTVFRALITDIHLLPGGAVEPVVRYYAHLIGLAAFADDLRSPEFRSLTPERRSAMFSHFIGMKVTALDYARGADAALARGIGGLNSSAAARSGLRPASSSASRSP
jgi:hypothetical protein